MKKIFTLVLIAMAAVTMSAQTISFASGFVRTLDHADEIKQNFSLNLTGEGASWAAYNDSLLAINADPGAEFTLAWGDNVEFSFLTTNGKEGIIIFKKDYVEFGGKNIVMHIYADEGEQIKACVASKSKNSGKEAIFAIQDESATSDDNLTVATYVSKAAEAVNLTFTAAANEVVIKETNNGFRLFNIKIGDGTGVENVAAGNKAQKIVEDGQIVIIRNGVRYNLLGAKL